MYDIYWHNRIVEEELSSCLIEKDNNFLIVCLFINQKYNIWFILTFHTNNYVRSTSWWLVGFKEQKTISWSLVFPSRFIFQYPPRMLLLGHRLQLFIIVVIINCLPVRLLHFLHQWPAHPFFKRFFQQFSPDSNTLVSFMCRANQRPPPDNI